MKFISFFAGIGGFDLALQRAGHECVGMCEIDKKARQFYDAQLGLPAFAPEDIRQIKAEEMPHADLWCGGFPCQDISVAGKRGGIRAKRSGLIFTLLKLIRARKRLGLMPPDLLLENVPGLLSGGDDDGLSKAHGGTSEGNVVDGTEGSIPTQWMGTLQGELARLGYGTAWRCLDAQFAGLAQRRARVFIVASARAGTDPRAVLFERHGGERDSEAGRKAQAETPAGVEGGAGGDRSYNIIGGGQRSPRHAYETEATGALNTRWLRASGNEAGTVIVAALRADDGRRGRHGDEGDLIVSSVQGGGQRGHRVDAEGAAGGHLIVEGDSYASTPDLPRLRAGCGRGGEAFVAFDLPAGGARGRHARAVEQSSPLGVQPGEQSAAGTLVFAMRGREGGNMPEVSPDGMVPAIRAPRGGSSHSFIAFDPKQSGSDLSENISPTLRAGGHRDSHANGGIAPAIMETRFGDGGNLADTLDASVATKQQTMPEKRRFNAVLSEQRIRRLTPRECERLQGFPDGWTCLCPAKGDTWTCVCADGPRYRCLGNAVAVPVVEWIGRRLRLLRGARDGE
jgi:DNA (cytosine-5)-methyltransferase 1